MFEASYQRELAALRETGRAFAQKHPTIAGMLAAQGDDPDVERLLEGFAFLAARVRQRIDDASPELVESLAELLLPDLLRPTPASTIVAFQPPPHGAHGALHVPRGARLMSRPVDGTRCTFTTTQPLDILPLRLVQTELAGNGSTQPTLTLRFEIRDGAAQAVFRREGIRLHLHGEPAAALQLHLWLTRYLLHACVHVEGQPPVTLGAACLRATGFAAEHGLWPWPAFAPHSIRLLREYFCLPAKFLFVELIGLDRAAHLACDAFELRLTFREPPPLAGPLPDDLLRLHCVPAVNLFEASAEPVRADARERPTLLRAEGLAPEHAEVYEVRSVTGVSPRGARRAYAPFHAFRHAPWSPASTGFYKLTRERSLLDPSAHTFLSLQHDTVADAPDETLSIDLTCTNRGLAQALQATDVSVPTTDTPPGVSFVNLTRVSAPRPAPLGAELLWRFVSQLACTRRSLADADALRGLLALHAADPAVDALASRRDRAHADAIRSVAARTVTRVLGGAPARGTRYTIELDQAGFACAGEAHLFGALLHRVLAIDAPLNGFAELSLVLLPSGTRWSYDADASP